MKKLTIRFLKITLTYALSMTTASPAFAAAKLCSAALSSKRESVATRKFVSKVFNLSPARQLYTQEILPIDAQHPTFLLMPGVVRGLDATDKVVQNLAKQGFGVVTMNFSLQPFSVNTLPEGTKPALLNKTMSFKDLAFETDQLAASLKAAGHDQVIPVSLSFSGGISPFLKNHPLIIETVPMTSAAAVNPDLEKYRQMLLAAQVFNPFFGAAITRSSLDSSYRNEWAPTVDAQIAKYKLSETKKSQMIDSYISLSRSAEGASWANEAIPSKTRRIFVVAGKDSPVLLKNQFESFKKTLAHQKKNLFFLVLEADHVLPTDQPEIYINILKMAATGETDNMSGVVIVTPSKNTYVNVPLSEATKIFDKM